MSRKWKADSVKRSRCKHAHCTDCATRRGTKRGVRNARHAIKNILRKI